MNKVIFIKANMKAGIAHLASHSGLKHSLKMANAQIVEEMLTGLLKMLIS